jgi:hypothetical protein
MRWTGHVTRMGEIRNSYKILVVRPGRKGPLGRPRRRWEYNRMGIKNGVGNCGLGSYGSREGPVAGCCEHGNEPSGSIK